MALVLGCSFSLPRRWSSAEREFRADLDMRSVPVSSIEEVNFSTPVPETMTRIEEVLRSAGITIERLDRNAGLFLASLIQPKQIDSYWSGESESADYFYAIIRVAEAGGGSNARIAWKAQLGCVKPGPIGSSDVTVIIIDGDRPEIRGGEFNGGLNVIGSDLRMFGGHAVQLFLSNDSISPGPNCSEIHGGEFESLFVAGPRVLLFGLGFVATSPQPGIQQISGTLEDGTRIDAPVFIETDGRGGQVELLASGSPGCP
jgi:hypothetical protein